MNKNLKCALAALLSMSMALSPVSGAFAAETAKPTPIRNVILMIPDGMPVSSTTIARWYQGGQPLAMDPLACGLVRTYSADAAIADSAPAGTAMATGYKSHTGYVGVLPEKADMPLTSSPKPGDEKKPVATILEGAKLLGKATGVVATSEITHATPADFTSHVESRKNYDDIGEQQVYQNIDVVLGAGSKFLTADYRKDKEDLIQLIKSRGYSYITSPSELKNTKSSKLWGMFADESLSYDLDRNAASQPSLSDMTTKAINMLSKDTDGFFLMVEGSKIDWANHANDPVGAISDVLAFDKAVKAALDFAKKDGHTVVIIASDHGTGGMTIGSTSTNSTYDKLPLSDYMTPLKKATLTGEGLESKLNADRSNVADVMKTYYGLDDLSKEELDLVKAAKAGSLNYTVGPMISKRANIGWTTTGHTGEEVALYVYSPAGQERLTGVVQNTDIARYMARLLGINFDQLNKTLFVDASKGFRAKGAQVQLSTDAPNTRLDVAKGSTHLVFDANKSTAILNGKPIQLKGVTVYSGSTFYVPQQALDLLK